LVGPKPLSTYGHFTAMQVRGRAVRGLDRHLRRLDDANRELFGTRLDPDEVRRAIRDMLGDATDASARVYVIDGVLSAWAGPPNSPPAAPRRLASVPYVRPFAHLKHLGGFGQSHHARLAERAGFDDVLLTAADGTVSETSIANIGFFDRAGAVVWPEPPWLHGVAMQLIEAGMPTQRRRVTRADLGGFRGAFLANSVGVVPVAGIDEVAYPAEPALVKTVVEALESAPWDPI
jgi:branched-subunit amino acid aminotransferase/4-amino-4-deoxychorismate lyase